MMAAFANRLALGVKVNRSIEENNPIYLAYSCYGNSTLHCVPACGRFQIGLCKYVSVK